VELGAVSDAEWDSEAMSEFMCARKKAKSSLKRLDHSMAIHIFGRKWHIFFIDKAIQTPSKITTVFMWVGRASWKFQRL
jgi:hypothetical protein